MDQEFPHGYICGTCAKKKGLRWPKGHCATATIEECPYCGKEKSTTSISDWLKPGQRDIPLGSWD